MSSSFEERWAAWVSELDGIESLATSAEDRARVARVKQAVGIDMLAVLCHDVKDPLAAVLMGAALLQKSPRPPETVVEMIVSASRRLDRVVTAANDLARLRRGDFQVRLRPIPLASLVATVVANQQKTATSSIDLQISADGANVMGDASATSRIISELLQNAIAFSNEGAVVEVRVDVEGEQAVVRIRDSGPGIDEQHLPHLFDEVRNRAHRPRRGAGRGLPIAGALAELQNATLIVERRDPTGCEATLKMNLAPRSETSQS